MLPESVSHTERKILNPPKRTAHANACSSHCCDVEISGKFVYGVRTVLKVC